MVRRLGHPVMTKASHWWALSLLLLASPHLRGQSKSPPAPVGQSGEAGAESSQRRPLKVVLWLGGFAHEFKTVGAILSEALPRQLPMKMSIAWNGDFLDAPERPDVILMYHCHKSAKGVLTGPQQGKLLTMVREGVGVVAVHASYYSFLKWDAYHRFHGARFIKHGKSEARLRVTPARKQHPLFKGLDTPFELVSELYQSTLVPEDCHVLAHSQETRDGKVRGKPQPSVWTRTYGRGRVVTILPGHWPKNFRMAPFQRLILNSMVWAAPGEGVEAATAIELNPEREQAALSSFKLPEGFEISLVAAEPHLANPISMTLDEHGRIYVSNAHSYRQKWWLMNPPPAREPTNPVVRLTPGPDGRAVEATVVAEGFEHPVMGLAVHGERLWVSNLNRLFVTELDDRGRMVGDREVLIRDAATPWNPFGMYRVVFGPDGLLYLSIGDHATRLLGTTGSSAVRQDNKGSGGVFRFRPDGSDLELLLQGMRAPFTLGFTPFGRLWVITNGEGSPNCLLDAVRGTDYRFRNRGPNNWSWLVGAEPLAAPAFETSPGAHTAVLPYYSSSFPKKYWGNLFVSNFGVHGSPAKKNEVLRLVLDDRGRVVRREPFVSSSDPKFRPTQVSLAPDGSLYMLDWYGKDDENDLTGRLYRIRYAGDAVLPDAGIGLGSSNHEQRRKAKAALLAADPAVSLPVLDRALSGEDPLAAAQACWTLRRSGWAVAADHIRKALPHRDWRVRRLALQLLREMGTQKKVDLQKLLVDRDPAVRLEAALGFRVAATRCAALVKALRGGAARIRRLRFVAALELAHHGQREHFAALLADEDSDVRLAGLTALDEAFYESSKGFRVLDTEQQNQLTELDRRIAASKARLETENPEQLGARRQWEAGLRQEIQDDGWLVVRPKEAHRRSGTALELQADMSLLATGKDPDTDSYTVTLEVPAGEVTGLRLEAIPDKSLTGGRYSRGNGNFVLTHIRIGAGPANNLEEVSLVKAVASYSQKDWGIEKALDPDKSRGWAVDGNRRGGPARVAVFTFADPVKGGRGHLMRVELEQDCPIKRHNIGRFRLSLTSLPEPALNKSGLPITVAKAVMLDPGKRSVAQERELVDLYRSTSPELKQLGSAIADLERRRNQLSVAGVDPATTARKALAHFIAAPGRLDVADLLDLARRWPHKSLKGAVGEIVRLRLGAAEVSASEFARGQDALTRMGLPTRDAGIDRARTRILRRADGQKDVGAVGERLALLRVLEAGDARARDLFLLKRFLADEDAAVRAKACGLLGIRHAGDAAAVAICRALIFDDGAGLAQRLDALATMAELEKAPDEGTWTKLLLSSRRGIAIAALRSLQRCDDRATARHILESTRQRLHRRHGAAVQDDLTFTAATLAPEKTAGATATDEDKTSLRRMVLANVATGSPERGRLVFRTRACRACHSGETAGVRAPPLDHIAASHDAAYLIDSILYPDKTVKTGFLTQMITLRRGKGTVVVTGTLRRNISGEGRWAKVTDITGRRKIYRSTAIESVKAISLMPPGLAGTMSRAELVDLIAYLATLK